MLIRPAAGRRDAQGYTSLPGTIEMFIVYGFAVPGSEGLQQLSDVSG